MFFSLGFQELFDQFTDEINKRFEENSTSCKQTYDDIATLDNLHIELSNKLKNLNIHQHSNLIVK